MKYRDFSFLTRTVGVRVILYNFNITKECGGNKKWYNLDITIRIESGLVINMIDLSVFLPPATLTFLVIVAGYYLGKIKVHGMSFGLAAVLLCAVAVGWMISVSPLGVDATYMLSLSNSMKQLSSLGTALFVPAVGISAGYSLEGFRVKNLCHFVCGAITAAAGFLLVKCVLLFDKSISVSALLGILCGSLTSTPGMSAASELDGIVSDEVVLGYGSAYLFGLVFVVIFVQILTRKEEKQMPAHCAKYEASRSIQFEFLIQIGVTAIIGTLVGRLGIPFANISLGASGGMLCVGLAFGFLIYRFFPSAKHSAETVSLFRSIGLVFFLAGSGIPAGLQLNSSFHLKWLLYGMVFTVVPIMIVYMTCRFSKCTRAESAAIIAGGMTSTPAVGVLTDRNVGVDLSAYTVSYVGALMTMVIGIRWVYWLL